MGARAHSHTDTHTATLRRGDCRPRGSGACALLGEGQCVGLGAAGGQGRREGSLASGSHWGRRTASVVGALPRALKAVLAAQASQAEGRAEPSARVTGGLGAMPGACRDWLEEGCRVAEQSPPVCPAASHLWPHVGPGLGAGPRRARPRGRGRPGPAV